MQDTMSECQESSRKSRFGARSIAFSKGNLKRSSVFRQANIEKTLKNRGKGTKIMLRRTGVKV